MGVPTFRHDLHVELWDWLSKNPGQGKYQWPRWVANGGDIDAGKNYCVACLFNVEHKAPTDHPDECTCCPLCIDGRDTLNNCMNGLFFKWFFAKDHKEKKKAAEQIRDIPLRNDWDWKETTRCNQ
jgi:hypothetical protein